MKINEFCMPIFLLQHSISKRAKELKQISPCLPPLPLQLRVLDSLDASDPGEPSVVSNNILHHQVTFRVKFRCVGYFCQEGFRFLPLLLDIFCSSFSIVSSFFNGHLLQLQAHQTIGTFFRALPHTLMVTEQFLITRSFALHRGYVLTTDLGTWMLAG